jgi:type IV pilus assembly protein PilO
MSVTRKWSALAAVLVLAILAAGWFLLVSPKRSEAADLQSQAATQEAANAKLVSELEQLKAQQAELPAQRAELATMRKQIPDNPALPTLIRSLTEAGRKVGVSIDTMSPAVPVAVVDPAAAVAAPVPTTESSSATSESSSTGSESSESSESTESSASADSTAASTTSTAAAPPAAPTLFQVPLTLEVSGSYFELEQFVNKLEGLKRSFLVTGFTLAPSTEGTSGTTGSTTAASGPAPGDLTLSLQGRVFLSPPVSATATPTTPVAPATSGQ